LPPFSFLEGLTVADPITCTFVFRNGDWVERRKCSGGKKCDKPKKPKNPGNIKEGTIYVRRCKS